MSSQRDRENMQQKLVIKEGHFYLLLTERARGYKILLIKQKCSLLFQSYLGVFASTTHDNIISIYLFTRK